MKRTKLTCNEHDGHEPPCRATLDAELCKEPTPTPLREIVVRVLCREDEADEVLALYEEAFAADFAQYRLQMLHAPAENVSEEAQEWFDSEVG